MSWSCCHGYTVFLAAQNEFQKLQVLAMEQQMEAAAEERAQAIVKEKCK